MFLNIYFQNQTGKSEKVEFKPYWVTVRDQFLDLSADYGKDPFTSFHLGVLHVQAARDFTERPDVLEFVSNDGMMNTHFFVFTYDPFDILDFYKMAVQAGKKWNEELIMKSEMVTLKSVDVKSSGFIKSNTQYNVFPDHISIGKTNTTDVYYKDIVSLTPVPNPKTIASFRLATTQNQNGSEQICTSIEQFKKLMNAVFSNWVLIKKSSK